MDIRGNHRSECLCQSLKTLKVNQTNVKEVWKCIINHRKNFCNEFLQELLIVLEAVSHARSWLMHSCGFVSLNPFSVFGNGMKHSPLRLHIKRVIMLCFLFLFFVFRTRIAS